MQNKSKRTELGYEWEEDVADGVILRADGEVQLTRQDLEEMLRTQMEERF